MRPQPCSSKLVVVTMTVLVAAMAACERRPEGADLAETTPPALPEPPDLYPPEVSAGFAISIAKHSSRTYSARGWTARGTRVRIEVEDGHNILFGPAALPVDDQRFQTEFVIEPTDRDHVFVYVTDGAGNRLAVIPLDTARALTVVDPEGRLAAGTGASQPK